MTGIKSHRLLFVAALALAFLWVTPLKAQSNLQGFLEGTPQSLLRFAPHTVGAVIAGGGDRLYVLNARKNQYLRIIVNSTGSRAFVAVFDSDGKEIAGLTEDSEPFEYKIPKTGKYYILAYSSPSVSFYDFTVRVDE
jgi:hypothetical protein